MFIFKLYLSKRVARIIFLGDVLPCVSIKIIELLHTFYIINITFLSHETSYEGVGVSTLKHPLSYGPLYYWPCHSAASCVLLESSTARWILNKHSGSLIRTFTPLDIAIEECRLWRPPDPSARRTRQSTKHFRKGLEAVPSASHLHYGTRSQTKVLVIHPADRHGVPGLLVPVGVGRFIIVRWTVFGICNLKIWDSQVHNFFLLRKFTDKLQWKL